MWTLPEVSEVARPNGSREENELTAGDCNSAKVNVKRYYREILQAQDTHHAVQTLDKTIVNLETELSAARTLQESFLNGSPVSEGHKVSKSMGRQKYFMVIGINIAFSSRKRRDSIRNTWMPQANNGDMNKEKKTRRREGDHNPFCCWSQVALWRIKAEERKHGDFMRIGHVEGYLELSGKTKTYFAIAVSLWDADFYVKVDDDVHVNIGIAKGPSAYRLISTPMLSRVLFPLDPGKALNTWTDLSKHVKKPRVYIGCMKPGPVLSDKDVRYYEPEHWKFGDQYFWHATGQLHAISKDLATYISINRRVLRKYINEDVPLGAWFIGVDVEHIDEC